MLEKLTCPTLLLNEQICRENIRDMAQKARRHGLRLRPHMKTHQSAEVGEWMRAAGLSAITVSSVAMADYFARAGWTDITIAFPVNHREIDEINRLAAMVDLQLLVVMPESVTFLREHLTHPVGFFIKIDCGSRRTGIPAGETAQIDEILRLSEGSSRLQFRGFLTHAGHAYSGHSRADLLRIHRGILRDLQELKAKYRPQYPRLIASMGNTPSCSIAEEFNDIDEIRPGNFVFYDVMQLALGACRWKQIAVALACPVVARHPERNEIVIYGGAVHLSKDRIVSDGKPDFGRVVRLREDGWSAPLPDTYVRSVSQEHGMIRTNPEHLGDFRVGELIGILPIHSCLTADLMGAYATLDGRKISMMNSDGK